MTEIIENSLYKGEVQVAFYPKSHMYKVTDEKNGLEKQRVKGVTTYLGIKDKSTPLVIWATELAGNNLLDILKERPITQEDIIKSVSLHRQKLEEASDIGTKIHDWCEYFINHNMKKEGFEADPQLPSEKAMLLGVNSFLDWYNSYKTVEFLGAEDIVYSRKEQAIGKLDLRARLDGKLTLIDFKTSNGLYNGVRFQTASYTKFREEEHPEEKYEQRMAIRLAKETEEEYYARQERSCYIRGKDPSFIKPYEALEVMTFENGEELEKDYQAFLDSKGLFTRDQETDFYKLSKK